MICYDLARPEDCPVVDQMLREMAAAEGSNIAGSPASLLEHGFGPTPRFRIILARNEAQVLGFCLFLPEYSSWRGEMGVFVQDIYLRPAARGLRLGKGLLAAAWRNAEDWTPAFMALMVKRSNLPAIGFYQALGFRLRDTADPFILSGEGLAALAIP